MVLLQEIPFELRSLSNEKRILESQLNTVNAAARRGQFKGGVNVCRIAFRATSQDCAAFKSVQRLPTMEQLTESIRLIQLQIDDLVQQQIESDKPMDKIPIMDEIIEIQPKNNTLRNALIIGGAILLLA